MCSLLGLSALTALAITTHTRENADLSAQWVLILHLSLLALSAEKDIFGMAKNAESYALKAKSSILLKICVNAQQDCTGQGKCASHAQEENNSKTKQKHANALKVTVGMDLVVLKSNLAGMAKNGIFSLLFASAHLELIGMEHTAIAQLSAEEVNILTKNMNVCALQILISRTIIVKRLAALVDKFGTEPVATAIQTITGMGLCACFALTVRCGILEQEPVNVLKDIVGIIITSVRNLSDALEDEPITRIISNVCAQKENSGTEPDAWTRLSVAVVRDGMIKLFHANAQSNLTGMEGLVCYVQQERSGIIVPKVVFVLLEPNGTINSAQLLRIAVEARFGTKILGLANALPPLSGIIPIALPTLVSLALFGIISKRNVFV